MGIDYYFSFGYGFFISPIKTLQEMEELESLIWNINKHDSSGLRYCQDAYNDDQKIFICVGGFNQPHWKNSIEFSNQTEVSFKVYDEDIKGLNEIADKYGINKEFNWYGVHYAR